MAVSLCLLPIFLHLATSYVVQNKQEIEANAGITSDLADVLFPILGEQELSNEINNISVTRINDLRNLLKKTQVAIILAKPEDNENTKINITGLKQPNPNINQEKNINNVEGNIRTDNETNNIINKNEEEQEKVDNNLRENKHKEVILDKSGNESSNDENSYPRFEMKKQDEKIDNTSQVIREEVSSKEVPSDENSKESDKEVSSKEVHLDENSKESDDELNVLGMANDIEMEQILENNLEIIINSNDSLINKEKHQHRCNDNVDISIEKDSNEDCQGKHHAIHNLYFYFTK